MPSELTPEEPANDSLVVMSEAGFAGMRGEEGAIVVERRGRFWGQTFPGFFQPIHQLASFAPDQIARPTWKCWGYRAALVPEAAQAANGSIPVHLMADLGRFDERKMDESRRRDLRRCRREVVVRRVVDPQPFVADGWSVYRSAKQRVAYGGMWSESEYVQRMSSRAVDPRRLIIAGFVNGKLGGYLESYVVDGILYGRDLYVSSELSRTGIATGLYVETFQIAVRAGNVKQVCLGPVLQERPGLAWFKEGLGVPVVQVPARVNIPGPIAAFIRVRRPAVYFRLTGRSQPALSEASDRGGGEQPWT